MMMEHQLKFFLVLFLGISISLAACAPSMKDVDNLERKSLSHTATEAERIEAIETIGQIEEPDPSALPPLYNALKNDTSPRVRAAAAQSIAQLGFATASQRLVEALEDDKDPTVRAAAIDGLYTLIGPNAEEQFIRYSRSDSSPQVRSRCVAYLGIIGNPEVEKEIRHCLETDPSAAVRAEAAIALGKLADEKSFQALKRAANKDLSENGRTESIIAIGQIPGWDSVLFLAGALGNSHMQDAAITSVHKNADLYQSRKIITSLMKIADKHPEMIVDNRVTDIFMISDDSRLNPYIQQYLLHPKALRDTIGMMVIARRGDGDNSLVPTLMDDLKVEEDPTRQIILIYALGVYRDARALPVLETLARENTDTPGDQLSELLAAIQSINEPRSEELLKHICCHTADKSTRAQACTAYENIAEMNPVSKIPDLDCNKSGFGKMLDKIGIN